MLVEELALRADDLTIESIDDQLSSQLPELQFGGKWLEASNRILEGKHINKVAIVVPYRDRLKNLKIFTQYMHQFLIKQSIINYGIYLVEPMSNLTFNRALLLNIGFKEAFKDENYECFIFHDVDMLPVNEDNEYLCDLDYPKQFATSISIYAYSEIDYFRNRYMGGVTGFTRDQFEMINGYSNSFFGWGGEG